MTTSRIAGQAGGALREALRSARNVSTSSSDSLMLAASSCGSAAGWASWGAREILDGRVLAGHPVAALG
jgi:hypothetical protein